jgi:regulator of sigma E protease
MIIKTILLLYLSVFAHELGHFITAKLLRIKILSASVFMYSVFYIFFKGTLYRIGFIPFTGYVNAPGIYQQKRYKKIIFFASGIFMNGLIIALTTDYVLITINTCLIISNLIPLRKTDGRNILESL